MFSFLIDARKVCENTPYIYIIFTRKYVRIVWIVGGEQLSDGTKIKSEEYFNKIKGDKSFLKPEIPFLQMT